MAVKPPKIMPMIQMPPGNMAIIPKLHRPPTMHIARQLRSLLLEKSACVPTIGESTAIVNSAIIMRRLKVLDARRPPSRTEWSLRGPEQLHVKLVSTR